MTIKVLISPLIVILLSIFCTSCAIPVGSYQKTKVKGVRVDEQGREVARIESISKYRKWQYILSPDGPGRKNYWVKSDVYLVSKNKHNKLNFLPTSENPKIYYSNFFPLNNPELWVALGVRSLFREGWTEIDIVKFDKDGVIDITKIQDCRVESVHGTRKSQWSKVDNTLQFETKQGRVLFDLSEGKIKK